MRFHQLSLRGISEAFRDRVQVDFEALGPGLIAIVGENGVGKSTLIGCLFAPWGMANLGVGPAVLAVGVAVYVGKLAVGGFLLALFETSIAKMRVFRVPEFLGIALMLGLLGALLRFVSASF